MTIIYFFLQVLEAVLSSSLLQVEELWAVKAARGQKDQITSLSPSAVLKTKVRGLDSPSKWILKPLSSIPE